MVRFHGNITPPYELTFADVFLRPQHFPGWSRQDVDITAPDRLALPTPLIAASMVTVTGRRLAETLTRRGGLAVFPKELTVEDVGDTLEWLKSRHAVYDTPVTVPADTTMAQARLAIMQRAHDALVVVDPQQRPVRLLTGADLEAGQPTDLLSQLPGPTDFLQLPPGTEPRKAFDAMVDADVNAAVITDGDTIAGILTRAGAVRATLYRPAVDDSGRLLTAVAVGMLADPVERATALIARGADVIILHAANASQDRAADTVRRLRDAIGDRFLVAGVAATGDTTKVLLEAGADAVKIGVGSGAMCTTRMVTGSGRPQLSSLLECAEVARELGKTIWSDGGVRYPRDVALALAAGASTVMIGSLFGRSLESPAPIARGADGRWYKEVFGVASSRAVRHRYRDKDPFYLQQRLMFDEGLSGSTLYLDPQRPGIEDIVDHLSGGLRSALTYSGATSIPDFQNRAVLALQSPASFEEGKPSPGGW
ncbi:GuaB1 family IMP dehydrogenase-related protein [Kitasatospora sp. KL5]|uniref:GuaB1 family IMP dehydrogenase-related protein n=1 Tax=Kitasatospora sp. KL5 TaxID=3425125 RepID=UPI003D6F1926